MLRDIVEVVVGVIFAFILYTALSSLSFSVILLFDVLSLAVIYFASNKGEIFGAWTGMACGLIQDSFAAGVFGISGISKTIMGFVAGVVSHRIDVNTAARRCLFVFFMLVLDLGSWMILYSLLMRTGLNTGGGLLFFRPFATAIMGCFLLPLIHKIRSASRRRT